MPRGQPVPHLLVREKKKRDELGKGLVYSLIEEVNRGRGKKKIRFPKRNQNLLEKKSWI